jgi:hypothetical protein
VCQLPNVALHTALKAVYLTTGAIASVRDRGHRTGTSARYHSYSSLIHVIHFEPCLIRESFIENSAPPTWARQLLIFVRENARSLPPPTQIREFTLGARNFFSLRFLVS